MQLSAACALLGQLRFVIQTAFLPTAWAVLWSPSIILRPSAISRLFMSHVWAIMGDGMDENGREAKEELITEHAYGVVVDIGAGHGHAVNYLNRSRVTKYVAVEPNVHMHDKIRHIAHAAGYDESSKSLTILSCGAEDLTEILSTLGERHSADVIISVRAMCSVPSPEKTIRALADEVLKPGGQFLFFEHVLSARADVAWWQRFWTPLWLLAFDGCHLDRPTHLWVEAVGGWREQKVWGLPDEGEEHLFWHRLGRFVKAP
ncbi:S-adenosyl-L-methionine-dependent methyltransferase [Leucogyrophana mollusca]|uniref:S-adenosyl-L-methionine-dependent methyltransferase n=1 Tax=Leucogyrophana mollusca TaxID=85980 RepID=A0ACB8BII4_9AGAM|nr:S-adenosyl-L-methionine-dependent methyltransferase [Leucogyrophana mollusca]